MQDPTYVSWQYTIRSQDGLTPMQYTFAAGQRYPVGGSEVGSPAH